MNQHRKTEEVSKARPVWHFKMPFPTLLTHFFRTSCWGEENMNISLIKKTPERTLENSCPIHSFFEKMEKSLARN